MKLITTEAFRDDPALRRDGILRINDADNDNDDDDNDEEGADDDYNHNNNILMLYQQERKRSDCWRIISGVMTLACIIFMVTTATVFVKNSNNHNDQTSASSTSSHATTTFSNLLNVTLPQWKPLPPSSQTLTKIAFGSCSSQRMPQPYWDTLVNYYQPQLLILMGDNVYGDCDNKACTNLKVAYQTMARHPSVIGAAPSISILATLDDHDYGQGNSHVDNPYKDIAQEMFREFFYPQEQQIPMGKYFESSNNNDDENDNDDIRDGVYRANIWGEPGRRVQIIMLDTRYNRSPFLETEDPNNPYKPYNETENAGDIVDDDDNNNSTEQVMLGERQWRWLEQQLLEQQAELRIIVSSIQVWNNSTSFEAWRHLPKEQERLFDLIQQTKQPLSSFLFLSGDRHVGAYYKYPSHDKKEQNAILEVTASSFTHSIPYGAFGDGCTSAADCDEVDPSRIGDFVRENLFGSLDIYWDNQIVSVSLRRAESSYGAAYFTVNDVGKHDRSGDANLILQSMTISFAPPK